MRLSEWTAGSPAAGFAADGFAEAAEFAEAGLAGEGFAGAADCAVFFSLGCVGAVVVPGDWICGVPSVVDHSTMSEMRRLDGS